ncbi:hypothetical protein LJC07_07770 [Christensenellaceae bacterium OttesenSCG-928-L17]|nr:hypothetical protein [Christensenellaceae bacterium OttesenSCG-928-L17]
MDYWQKQNREPLFKNLDFERPEQKTQAGTLTIIGGNSHNFRAVAGASATAEQVGVHQLNILLPDSLKKTIPTTMPNITFAPSEPSGGFGKSAEPVLSAAINHADAALIIGDLGRNAETATTIANVVKNTTQPLLLTRDTIDLITSDAQAFIERPSLTLFVTLPQLQKLFRTIYYPRVITLSQPTNQLIETLHKFTITYNNITIATTHSDQYIVAQGGQVVTTSLSDTNYSSMSIWQGNLATTISIFQIRQPDRSLASATTAILV